MTITPVVRSGATPAVRATTTQVTHALASGPTIPSNASGLNCGATTVSAAHDTAHAPPIQSSGAITLGARSLLPTVRRDRRRFDQLVEPDQDPQRQADHQPPGCRAP